MPVHTKPTVGRPTYYKVYVALLLLLGATIGAAYLHLGELNVVVAMTIAVAKMILVILFFMHVRYEHKLTWLFVAAGFFWLIIMVTLTMADFLSR